MGEMSDVLSEEREEDGRSKFFVQPHADWGKVVHILIENDEVEIRWQSISRRTFPASSARPASPIRAVSGCMRIMRRGVVSLVLCVSICLNTFYFSFLKVRSICVFQACATSLAGQTNFFCKNPRFDPSVDQAGQGAVAHTYGPLRPSLRRGKGLPVNCEKFLKKYAGLPYEWQGSYSNGVFLSMQIHVVAV